MSEERDDLLPEFDENEEDALLQVQMKIYNFIMGYWKKGLVVVGAILSVVLVRGLYFEHVQDVQRGFHKDIALVQSNLPEINQRYYYGLGPMDNPNDMKTMQTLRESAAELEKIASKSEGTATWFAWMEAAKIWHRANEFDSEKAALGNAITASTEPIYVSSSTLLLATRYLESENPEKAIETLEGFIAKNPEFGIEQARLHLVQIYTEQGNAEKSAMHMEALQGSGFVSVNEVQELLSRITVE